MIFNRKMCRYCVESQEIKGMRTEMGSRVQDLLAELRQVTDKPVGVGFGISSPEQAKQIKE